MRFSDWMEARQRKMAISGYKKARWDIRPKSDPGLVSKRMSVILGGKSTGAKGGPAPEKTPSSDRVAGYEAPAEKPADMDDDQWEKFQNQIKRYRDS